MIGLGYVGLTTGLGFAKLGATVVGVEVSKQKLDQLKQGEIPFFENGLPEMLKEMMNSRYFLLSDNLTEALSGAEVIIIAVGTPPDSNGRADLSSVFAVAQNLSKELNHSCLLIIKSTVPVGTNRKVLQIVCDGLVARGKEEVAVKMGIASLPEFLREGSALADMMNPDRIVVGLSDASQLPIVEELHKGLKAPWHVLSLESAELTKYASNAFLATKISINNELANICARVGADFDLVRRAIGADPRIGEPFMYAGPGFGGSCFPKDVKALIKIAKDYGYTAEMFLQTLKTNEKQKNVLADMVIEKFGDNLKNKIFSVWGLAFKAGTDDMRESSALTIINKLIERGAKIQAYDPEAMKMAKSLDYFGNNPAISYFEDKYEALSGTDGLLIITEWKEFCAPDFSEMKKRLKTPLIFDGRLVYDVKKMKEFGFEYHSIGRKFE